MSQFLSTLYVTVILCGSALYFGDGSVAFEGIHIHNVTKVVDGDVTEQLFKEFVLEHNRTYVDDYKEYNKRLHIFKVSNF